LIVFIIRDYGCFGKRREELGDMASEGFLWEKQGTGRNIFEVKECRENVL